MKNIIFPISVFAILLLSSCGEDFFQNTVEIEIPDHTPTIALTAVVEEGAELFETFVSFSQSKNSQSALTPLSDAKVRLLKDGNLLADLAFVDSTGRFASTLTQSDLTQGSTYRIEAEHPDYESVFAEQSIPNVVSIDDFEYSPDGAINEFGENSDRLKVTLTDRSGENNYYMVNAFRRYKFFDGVDTVIQIFPFELRTFDPSIVFGYSPINYLGTPMISDAIFPGKKYDLVFNTYQLNLQEGDEMIIELKTITRERYLFLLSLKRFFDSEDNPFAEPVTVFSNIENGNGAFGAEAVNRFNYTHQ